MNINDISYLNITKAMKRGTAEVLENTDDGVFIREKRSGVFFMACDDPDLGMKLLEKHEDMGYHLLVIFDTKLADRAFEKYGFTERLDCWQAAYLGPIPEVSDELRVRVATLDDLDAIIANYNLVSSEEVKISVEYGDVLVGFDKEDNMVGFIGEHTDGSGGMLYVFPEHRRKGYGAEFEKHLFIKNITEGFIPFGHVVKDNFASMELQRSMGLTIADKPACWLWKEE